MASGCLCGCSVLCTFPPLITIIFACTPADLPSVEYSYRDIPHGPSTFSAHN